MIDARAGRLALASRFGPSTMSVPCALVVLSTLAGLLALGAGAPAAAASASPSAAPPAAPAVALDCELLFAGGRVVDGTGAPWFRADVCVAGGRIAAVGQLAAARARRRIDASRLVITPGFIDMLGQSEYNVLVDNRAASKITQGITTEITGEGSSIAPVNQRIIDEGKEIYEHYGVRPTWTTLHEYWRAFERARPAINLGTFVGAGGVRNLVIGESERPATAAELAAMEKAVAQAMEEGAFGLSTSLQYVPDRFASTEEIIALAKVAARYGGSYITHQRSEQYQIDASLDEVFRIAREAKLPAQIYHLKVACQGMWGQMPHVLARLEAARAEGLDVSADQYPWTAGENGLDANLPLWVRDGGPDKLIARLADPAVRARVRAELHKDDRSWENQYQCAGGGKGVLIATVVNPALKKYEGQTVADIAKAEGKDEVDVIMDLVAADRAHTSNIIFIMDDKDVRAALRHPFVSLCTDSGAEAVDGIFGQEKSHPRAWASAPRILGHYVRDEHLLPLEEAVRKMTSLPASRMGLADRGIVRAGMAADLVAFDPEKVRDVSTYTDPLHYSEGIPYVAVNGQLVVDGGKITDARPGRPLYGPGYKPQP
ncbi:MAG TPA: D-aminoacylase [Thermoanaerobaculia bacterium]|nr:D-aminoacylase [Thermoanaerobaculia bacterium]